MIFNIGKNKIWHKQLFKHINYSLLFCLTLTIFCNIHTNAQTPQKKVVMISIDGTPDYLIDKFLKTGVLPANGAFARMKKNGAYAETVYPVNVASTGPSHIAIFTGASPVKTGMVGNSFRRVDQSWSSPTLYSPHNR
jgi:predicted AlkP superfamily pyrophosphatase or phosphodiesterase